MRQVVKLIKKKIFFLMNLKISIFLKLIKIIVAIKYSNKINTPVILILTRNAVKNEISIVFIIVIFLLS